MTSNLRGDATFRVHSSYYSCCNGNASWSPVNSTLTWKRQPQNGVLHNQDSHLIDKRKFEDY